MDTEKDDLGFIKIHRSIKNWRWSKSPNTYFLFISLLVNANYKTTEFMGFTINRGSLVFGFNAWSAKTGLTIMQLRTALTHLKSTNEITIKTTNKFSIISITNWEKYQSNNNQVNKRATNEQQTSNNILRSKERKKERINTILHQDQIDVKKEEIILHDLIFALSHIDEDYLHVAKRLTEDQQTKLVDAYGDEEVIRLLKAIADWKKYSEVKNVYMTVKKWANREGLLNKTEFSNMQKNFLKLKNGEQCN